MSAAPLAQVVACGLALPQDLGRWGFQGAGVPVSGALDTLRYRIAAMLVSGMDPMDAPPGPAVVEVLSGVLVLDVERATAIAVVGSADVSLDAHVSATGVCLAVQRGQVLAVTPRSPAPVYVAIAGWEPGAVLGSSSHDTFSRIGPPALVRGTVLQCSHAPSTELDEHGRGRLRNVVGAFHRPLPDGSGPVRIVLHHAHGNWPASLAGESWSVDTRARSGWRMAGPTLDAASGTSSRPSNPVVVGGMQVTDAGGLVVLGPDGGLTGGYPLAGVVASCDRARLAAVAPGDPVRFAIVTREAAQEAAREAEQWLRAAVVRPGALH